MVNDGIGNGNFTTLKPFAFWTQHVLPLVYGDEISYMETLGKMRDIMNELIKNNNNLPEYIQQMIEEYISSGAIEEVIDKILSNFILNVKYPPTGVPKAKGDGTTNDHDSIQGCIDYAAANGGGIVYLPAGKYLTSPLVLKSGVTLLGFGRYAVSLVLAGGATTHLITGTVSDAGILNMTLDAKMSSQVNRVDAIELIGNHIDIRGCLVRDCYTSINVQKDGTAVNICDVICEVASDACLRIGGTNGGLLVDGLDMTGLSTNLGTAYIVTDSNGDIYRNINIHGTGALGIDVSGSGNYFDGKISGVTKDYDDISGDNTFNLFGKTRVENLTGEVVENANAFSQVAVNGIERQGANISDNAVNAHTINAKDVVINPTNPLTYKTPTELDANFNSIPFKDSTDTTYNVLVYKQALKVEYTYNTLNEAISANLPVGSVFNTLGYNTLNDGGAMTYVVESTGTPDGGSVISYNSNFAIAMMPEKIYPEYFGITPDMGLAGNAKWTNYQNYVNNTPGKHFIFYGKEYVLYQPLVFFKNMEGTPGIRPDVKNSTVLIAGTGGNFPNISTLGVPPTRYNRNLDYTALACTYVTGDRTVPNYKMIHNISFVANEICQISLFVADDQYLDVKNCEFQKALLVDLYLQSVWGSSFYNIRFYCLGKYSIHIGAMGTGGSNYTTLFFQNVLIVWVPSATTFEHCINLQGSGNTVIFDNVAMDNPNAKAVGLTKNLIRVANTKSLVINNLYCENVRANHVIYGSHANITINGVFIYNGNINDILYLEEADSYGIVNNYSGPAVTNGAILTCVLSSGVCNSNNLFSTNKNTVVCAQTGRAYFFTNDKCGYVTGGTVYEITGTAPATV